MSLTKRSKRMSVDCDSDDESAASLTVSATHHRTSRRFCPHCNEVVSRKTFQFHKRLHYDKVVLYFRRFSVFLVTAASCSWFLYNVLALEVYIFYACITSSNFSLFIGK